MQDAELDVDLFRAEELGDGIIEPLNRLRAAAPIYWSAKRGMWLVTGHAEVAEAFRGELPLSSGRHKLIEAIMPDPAERAEIIPYMMQVFPHFLTNTDPPGQLRLRRLMMKAFSRKIAEANRPFAAELIKGLLDQVEARGEVEFMEDVARPIPANIILRMMGLGQEHMPRLKRWAYYLNAGLGGAAPNRATLAETERCLIEMRDIFLDELRKREAAPDGGFLSELIAARDGADKLTEDEIVAICHLTLIAGHDTTANSLALGTATLAEAPQMRAYIRNHPEAIGDAVMEIMRLSGVSTSMGRIATDDFEWHGHSIKAGQVLLLMIIAANRDPQVFADPLRLDPARPQLENMTFAPGLHHCIGHLMAKMQLSEFFPELVRRFDRFEVLDHPIQFGGGISFRGPERLRMRFTPIGAARDDVAA